MNWEDLSYSHSSVLEIPFLTQQRTLRDERIHLNFFILMKGSSETFFSASLNFDNFLSTRSSFVKLTFVPLFLQEMLISVDRAGKMKSCRFEMHSKASISL